MKINTVSSIFSFLPQNIDAVLISCADNIGYIAEFWGSFARLLITKTGTIILISDPRYTPMAQDLCKKKGLEYREITREKDFFSVLCLELNITTLGFESADVTVDRWEGMKKSFGTVELVPLQKTLEILRETKSDHEIEKLKRAAEIGDACLQVMVQSFYKGITEKEAAWIFEKAVREQFGVEALSFSPIVSFGENTASAHSLPSEKKLEKDMPILIDCGVFYEHYASDLTRCFWFGEGRSAEYLEWKAMYDLVCKAQKSGIEKMVLGKEFSAPDIAARKTLGAYEQYFQYAFGHGVGVNVHESPVVSSRNKSGVFKENMVVTAEPGIHFPGKFGIRIEDLMHITKKGAEYLSAFPKDKFLIVE